MRRQGWLAVSGLSAICDAAGARKVGMYTSGPFQETFTRFWSGASASNGGPSDR